MSIERVLISISGCVQGIGFRPFVYRLAREHRLTGSISNTCTGVEIDVQGKEEAIFQFQKELIQKKPERASITEYLAKSASLTDFSSFEIRQSVSDADKALALLPDTAMCNRCFQELFDPKNRRYQYPFLHCISCGPRFSLFLRMPFDRDHTTMAEFQMCSACKNEYINPENRRFYSQTNCCSDCGPQLQLVDAKTSVMAGKHHALDMAAAYLQEGKILALKNTGGYLLLVDATNEHAVQRLRLKKQRPNKPFALLLSNLIEIEKIAHLDCVEKSVLISPAAPIVLLKKKKGQHAIAPSVAHHSPCFGIMLPHNALQYLLMQRFANPLVATSGNISGKPLCISEQEAFDALSSVADAFLIHNRTIKHRLDDSIVQVMAGKVVIMRKARGYIPDAIALPDSLKAHEDRILFAAGSQMKNSFAFLKQGYIYSSQHIGDLDFVDSCKAYEEEISSWEILLGAENIIGIGDKHSDYYSSGYLQRRNIFSEGIQHHAAHTWASAIDNKLLPPFLSIAWDGTGYGDDGTVWGGEVFAASEKNIDRIASLFPFPLPGSEKAVKEPRRSLLGLFYALLGEQIPQFYIELLQQSFTREEITVLLTAIQKKIHAPLCSSMGRLFDSVSALLGLCWISDFEGQAALMLENAASQATRKIKRYDITIIKNKNLHLLDWRPMIGQILEDKRQNIPTADIALAFHETLAHSIVELAHLGSKETILLTGGVMQNKLLVEKTVAYLKDAGFKPYIHGNIPPNDGGVAVGQLMTRIIKNSH